MDHLPLPHDPTIGTFDILFLVTQPYDTGDFLSYPERHGWSLRLDGPNASFIHRDLLVEDEKAIGGFLQTWLYFGLLFEFECDVELKQFQRHTDSGETMLSSSMLLEIIPGPADISNCELSHVDEAQFHDHRERLNTCLEEVWRYTRYSLDTAGPVLASVCLGIAALAELLQEVLVDICHEREAELPRLTVWRVRPNCDYGKPLLALMKAGGWCSNKLLHIERTQNDTIGRLWYYANLRAPLAHEDHTICSVEQCRHLQVDNGTYTTRHSLDECQCVFSGPNSETLASIVSTGGLPLVTVSSDTVNITSATRDTMFVAISHVWADGLGNQDQNELPWCVLNDLQQCVNAAMEGETSTSANIPFWIDTLCLPRRPLELRRKAIVSLSEPFKRASKVLVLDAYLRKVKIDSMTLFEIVARVSISNWTQRLWTFSEGRLASSLWFQFYGKAINLLDVISRGWGNPDVWLALPTIYVNYGLLLTYNATAVTSQMDISKVDILRDALKTRSTSRASDEALCLGSILDLDMTKLVEAEDSKKMATFWALKGSVPLTLAFSDSNNKVVGVGSRWAPASFTGDLEADAWTGGTDLEGRVAIPSARGLVVELPSLQFTSENMLMEDSEARTWLIRRLQAPKEFYGPLELQLQNGRWYRCVHGGDWHQDPAALMSSTTLEVMILLSSPLLSERPGQGVDGLVVAVESLPVNSRSPISATAHFRLYLSRCTPLGEKYLSYVQKQAASIRHSLTADMRTMIDDWEANVKPIAIMLAETTTLFDDEFLCLASAFNRERGMNDDEYSVRLYSCNYVIWFLRVGDWFRVKQTDGLRTWCID